MTWRELACKILGHHWVMVDPPESLSDLIRTGYVCTRCGDEIEPLTF